MASTRKSTAKKSSTKKGSKRASTRRELIAPKGDARFIKRDTKGRIRESDDAGKSLAADRRTKAKKTVKSGHGDQGDQKKRAPARKK